MKFLKKRAKSITVTQWSQCSNIHVTFWSGKKGQQRESHMSSITETLKIKPYTQVTVGTCCLTLARVLLIPSASFHHKNIICRLSNRVPSSHTSTFLAGPEDSKCLVIFHEDKAHQANCKLHYHWQSHYIVFLS